MAEVVKMRRLVNHTEGRLNILSDADVQTVVSSSADSKLRGSGFDPHKGHRVVSLSKTH